MKKLAYALILFVILLAFWMLLYAIVLGWVAGYQHPAKKQVLAWLSHSTPYASTASADTRVTTVRRSGAWRARLSMYWCMRASISGSIWQEDGPGRKSERGRTNTST